MFVGDVLLQIDLLFGSGFHKVPRHTRREQGGEGGLTAAASLTRVVGTKPRLPAQLDAPRRRWASRGVGRGVTMAPYRGVRGQAVLRTGAEEPRSRASKAALVACPLLRREAIDV